MNETKYLHITPNCEDLLANRILKCPENNCTTTFTNYSNLQMHLTKHHKRITQKMNSTEENDKIKLYFCPDESCIYHEKLNDGKYFTSLKYIRQHYQKVHAEKKFKCDQCKKSFITEGALKSHRINCGRKFKCHECGWEYDSKEALQTHAKRKSHKAYGNENVKNVKSNQNNNNNNNNNNGNANKIKILPYKQKIIPVKAYILEILTEQEDKAIQTDFDVPSPESISCNIDNNILKRKAIVQPQDEMRSSKLSCNEGKLNSEEFITSDYNIKDLQQQEEQQQQQQQQEHHHQQQQQHDDECNVNFNLFNKEKPKDNLNSLISYGEDDTVNSCFEQLVDSSSFCHIETQTEFPSTSTILDQMLYSNMYTQTCDDFLTELGLADIQTQTNWSTINESECTGEENSVGGINNNITETTISGAHDELLVSTETQTSFTQCLLEYNGSPISSITQHTQTCETLLEGLFGGQDNDFITNFQSAYTQT